MTNNLMAISCILLILVSSTGQDTICSVGSDAGRCEKWNVGVLVNKMDYIVKGGQKKGTKL